MLVTSTHFRSGKSFPNGVWEVEVTKDVVDVDEYICLRSD